MFSVWESYQVLIIVVLHFYLWFEIPCAFKNICWYEPHKLLHLVSLWLWWFKSLNQFRTIHTTRPSCDRPLGQFLFFWSVWLWFVSFFHFKFYKMVLRRDDWQMRLRDLVFSSACMGQDLDTAAPRRDHSLHRLWRPRWPPYGDISALCRAVGGRGDTQSYRHTHTFCADSSRRRRNKFLELIIWEPLILITYKNLCANPSSRCWRYLTG